MNGVIYKSNSKNTKISGENKVDATYASIKATCSSTCPLKDKGCYSQNSFAGMIVKRLDRRARQHSTLALAKAEARCIDEAYEGGRVPQDRDLRIHISGDSRSIKGTRIINAAIARWKQRGGRIAWSYTHSWSKVHRREWSSTSILASIENIKQVDAVRHQGYAPAIIVDHFDNDKVFEIDGCKTKFIPCPAQTRKNVSCSSCQLCMKADWLYDTNRGIAFSVHGVKGSEVKRHLKVMAQ